MTCSRDNQSEMGGRFLPAIVILAALIALGGLLSVRADSAAESFTPQFLKTE
jgi:hypothetical protein